MTATSGWSRQGPAVATSAQKRQLPAAEKHLSANKQGRVASADHDPEENGDDQIKKQMRNLQQNRDARDALEITRGRREQRPQSHYPPVKHMPFAARFSPPKSTTIDACLKRTLGDVKFSWKWHVADMLDGAEHADLNGLIDTFVRLFALQTGVLVCWFAGLGQRTSSLPGSLFFSSWTTYIFSAEDFVQLAFLFC
nr:uncharacterized protein LOC127330854 [Lolium perenne]XP_051212892.1 uncharacterized protein LOC127330854 [Lolium perenne]